jgi:hypothetical protein
MGRAIITYGVGGTSRGRTVHSELMWSVLISDAASCTILHNQTFIVEAKGYIDTGSQSRKKQLEAALSSLQYLVA